MIHNQPVKPDRDFQLSAGDDGSLVVTGVLDKTTVTRILQESQNSFRDAVSMPGSIDLTGVNSVDSSGLALLIEWVRLGRRQNRTIKILNIPAQMLPLARLFGVEHLLH